MAVHALEFTTPPGCGLSTGRVAAIHRKVAYVLKLRGDIHCADTGGCVWRTHPDGYSIYPDAAKWALRVVPRLLRAGWLREDRALRLTGLIPKQILWTRSADTQQRRRLRKLWTEALGRTPPGLTTSPADVPGWERSPRQCSVHVPPGWFSLLGRLGKRPRLGGVPALPLQVHPGEGTGPHLRCTYLGRIAGHRYEIRYGTLIIGRDAWRVIENPRAVTERRVARSARTLSALAGLTEGGGQ